MFKGLKDIFSSQLLDGKNEITDPVPVKQGYWKVTKTSIPKTKNVTDGIIIIRLNNMTFIEDKFEAHQWCDERSYEAEQKIAYSMKNGYYKFEDPKNYDSKYYYHMTSILCLELKRESRQITYSEFEDTKEWVEE